MDDVSNSGAAATAPPANRRRALTLILFASAAFSTAGPLARAARPLHPLFVAFGRVALASLLLFALDRGGTFAAFRSLDTTKRRKIVAAGVILAAHFALFLWGLDTTSMPAAIALIALEPLSVVLFAWLFFGIRPNAREQTGLLLAMTGAVLLASSSGTGEHRLLGDVLVLAAVSLYGVYVAIARSVGRALPATSYAALVYGTAAAALACALPFTPFATPEWPVPSPSLLAVAGLACIPTLIGHTSVQIGARFLSPSTIALVSPGETLGGLVLTALFYGAVPSARELAGAAILLSGATLAILGAKAP